VGKSKVAAGDTWTKTDGGLSASMMYTAYLKDLSSPPVFTGKKYESPMWKGDVVAPTAAGVNTYRISSFTKGPPPEESSAELTFPKDVKEIKDDLNLEDEDVTEDPEHVITSAHKQWEIFWDVQEEAMKGLTHRGNVAHHTEKGLSKWFDHEKRRLEAQADHTELMNVSVEETGPLRTALDEYNKYRSQEILELQRMAKNMHTEAMGLREADKKRKPQTTDSAVDDIRREMQKSLKDLTKYRRIKEQKHPEGFQKKAKGFFGPKGDPYMSAVKYIDRLKDFDAMRMRYPPHAAQALQGMREYDAERVKDIKEAMVKVLNAEKDYLTERAQRVEKLLSVWQEVAPEPCFDEFHHHLSRMHPYPSTIKEVTLHREKKKGSGIKLDEKHTVTEVAVGSEAEKRGIKPGHVVVAIDGYPAYSSDTKVADRLEEYAKEKWQFKVHLATEKSTENPFYERKMPKIPLKAARTLELGEVVSQGHVEYKRKGWRHSRWLRCYAVATMDKYLYLFNDQDGDMNITEKDVMIKLNLEKCEGLYDDETKPLVKIIDKSGIFGSTKHEFKGCPPVEWLQKMLPVLKKATVFGDDLQETDGPKKMAPKAPDAADEKKPEENPASGEEKKEEAKHLDKEEEAKHVDASKEQSKNKEESKKMETATTEDLPA